LERAERKGYDGRGRERKGARGETERRGGNRKGRTSARRRWRKIKQRKTIGR